MYIINNEKEEEEFSKDYYGNNYFTLTEKDIQALLEGKQLAGIVNDEYCIFIDLKGGK